MSGRGIPQGYDSKADWSLGITSQMRANEKSPGNSVSSVYQKNLNNLIVSEQSNASAKPTNDWYKGNVGWLGNLGGLVVDTAAKSVSFLSNTEDTVDTNKNSLWQDSQINANKKSNELATSESYNATMEKAMWSLSGDAARERQGLWPWQSLDPSTVGGMTRHGKGGLNEFGSNYADQDFMSYTRHDNWQVPEKTWKDIFFEPDKGKTINLQTRAAAESSNFIDQFTHPDVPGFRDEVTRHEVVTNTGLELVKQKARVTNMLNFPYNVKLVDEGGDAFFGPGGQQPVVTIRDEQDIEAYGLTSHNVWQGKMEMGVEHQVKLDEIDEAFFNDMGYIDKGLYYFKEYVAEPVGDAVSGAVGFVGDALVDLNDTTILGKFTDHLSDSYNAAAYDIEKGKELVVEIAEEVADLGLSYYDAVKSVGNYALTGELVMPHEYETMRIEEAKIQSALAEEKALALENAIELEKKVVEAHKQYGEARIESNRLTAEQNLKDAEERTDEFYASGSTLGEQRENYITAAAAQIELEKEMSSLAQLNTVGETVHQAEVLRTRKAEADRIAEAEAAIQTKKQGLHKDEEQIRPDPPKNVLPPWNDKKVAVLSEVLARNEKELFGREYQLQQEKQARIDETIDKHYDRNKALDPSQLLGDDPFRFSTFAYPKDVTQNMENGHYMLFYINVQNKTKYSYDGINEKGGIVPVGDWIMNHETKTKQIGGAPGRQEGDAYTETTWKKGASKEFDTNIDYQRNMVLSGHKGSILRNNQAFLMKGRKSYQGLDSVLPTTTRITDSVALYLPPAVKDDLGVTYENSALGMAGFLAFSGIDVVNKWKEHDFEGVTDAVLGMGEGIIVEAIKKLGIGAFGAITGAEGDVVGAFDKAFGQTLNPYIEVTFNSMGMRSFDYTFRFAPKSEEETQDVKDIINLFRFHMAPELKGTNHRYLTLPSTFDIHYMYQMDSETARENPFYNKIATCVLEACNVDYTPNGVQSFASGAPTQINMTLNFKETKMLTKQKISDGF